MKLHHALNRVLTRGMAANAYKKAITIVMTDAWHKAYSRTYGGRNKRTQIAADAQIWLVRPSRTGQHPCPNWLSHFTPSEVQEIWDDLDDARRQFFATGDAQSKLK